jgi:hypothetical protein
MRLLFVPLITLIITGCDGHYRYPCQDPANWGKLECNNDVCKAEGTCTTDVLGRSIEQSSNIEPSQETSEETTEPCSPAISSDEGNTETEATEEVPTAKLHMKKPNKTDIVMDPEGDEYEPARTPPSLEEEVLTMNTVVDTAAHNAAIK